MNRKEAEQAAQHVLSQPADLCRVDYEAWDSAQELAAWAMQQVKRIDSQTQRDHNHTLEIDVQWLLHVGFVHRSHWILILELPDKPDVSIRRPYEGAPWWSVEFNCADSRHKFPYPIRTCGELAWLLAAAGSPISMT